MPGADNFFSFTAQQGTMFSGQDLNASQGPLAMLDMVSPFLGMQQPLSHSLGLFPGSFGFTGQNVSDMMRAEARRTESMRAAAAAAQQTDVGSWLKMTGGMMNSMGMPFGLNEQAGMRNAYMNAAPMMSMLGQFAPSLVDSLHGSKGSAALMATNLARGGTYGFDSSGVMGMSPGLTDQIGTAAASLYATPAMTAQMGGVGMGQLGAIFDEGTRRGYMPGSIGLRSRETQMNLLGGSGETRAELEQLDEGQFNSRLQKFDSNRIAGRMKELAGSVSAMREIFGANGQADAPIAQIFNALEAITQNKLATMPAAQVEGMVRRTKAIMETTGVGLDAMMAMSGRAASYGDTLGLDRSFAATAGQNAAMFGAGYKGAFGDFRAFGAMGVEEVQQREVMLSQRAAASDLAQNAGALIRTVEAQGGIGAGTKAGQLVDAIKNGQTRFNGASIYDALSSGSISSILQESGMSASGVAAFQQATRDKFGNQEVISQFGIGDTVRKLQPVEVARRVGAAAGESAIMSSLVASGMSQEEAVKLARQGGGGLLTALLESDDVEGLSTRDGRRKIIEKELTKTMGAERAAEMAGSVATNFESTANMQFQKWGYGDMTKFLQSQNRTVLAGQDAVRRSVGADAEIGKMLSPLGKSGPIQRIMDMIGEGMKDTDITTAIGKGLGGIEVGDVRKLVNDQNELRGLLSKDPDKRTELDDIRIRELRESLTTQVKETSERGDIDVGRQVSDEDLSRAAKGGERLMALTRLGDDAMEPGARQSAITRQNRLQLTRANNMFSALSVDDASLKKLGVGGAKRIQDLESKYLQLMKASGGDPDRLAKALAGDPSIPEGERAKILAMHKDLSGQMTSLHKDLSGGGRSMTEDEFKSEQSKMEAFRAERTAGDDEQKQSMLKKLSELTGVKELADGVEGDTDKALGGYNSETRRALMVALKARERLGTAAAAKGVKIGELDKEAYAEDFAAAGSLGTLEEGAGLDDIDAALSEFQPREEGSQQEFTFIVKEGTVKLIDDTTATFRASGHGGV